MNIVDFIDLDWMVQPNLPRLPCTTPHGKAMWRWPRPPVSFFARDNASGRLSFFHPGNIFDNPLIFGTGRCFCWGWDKFRVIDVALSFQALVTLQVLIDGQAGSTRLIMGLSENDWNTTKFYG